MIIPNERKREIVFFGIFLYVPVNDAGHILLVVKIGRLGQKDDGQTELAHHAQPVVDVVRVPERETDGPVLGRNEER